MYLSYALNQEGVLAYAINWKRRAIAFGDKIYNKLPYKILEIVDRLHLTYLHTQK